jgi:LPS-assembly protein
VTAAAIYTYAGPNSVSGVTAELQGITGVFGLKLTDHWSMQASAVYDLTSNKPLTDSLQIKYSDECFVLTATYTDSYITDPTRDLVADRSIMLRFEWKYLGQLNYRTTILDNIMPSSYTSPSSSP